MDLCSIAADNGVDEPFVIVMPPTRIVVDHLVLRQCDDQVRLGDRPQPDQEAVLGGFPQPSMERDVRIVGRDRPASIANRS